MLAVVVAASVALLVTSVALARRRRTAGPALSLGTPRGPAGVNHLAARVSELSDLGLHLRASPVPRRRLGVLLGLR